MSTLHPSEREKEVENASHTKSVPMFDNEKKTDNASNMSGIEDTVSSKAIVESEKDTPVDDDDEYPQGFKLLCIILALVLSVFLVALDLTIVATAIPRITDQFHRLNDVSWYGSAFLFTSGGFQSTWGKVHKFYPLKYTFLAAIFFFEIGSLICGVAPNSTALIVGRAIAGAASAGIGSGAFTIIAFITTPKNRPVFTGIIGVAYGIASVIGPLVGGVFADKVSWRWCFYINLPVGGLAAAGIFIFFQTPKKAMPAKVSTKEKLLQIDPVGTALISCAIIVFILAFQYGGQTHAWNSSTVIGLLVGFPLITIAFVAWEYYQGERAAFPPRLMKSRLILINSLYAFFFVGSYFVIVYYLPIYFQSIQNVSPTASGVRNLPLIISVSLALVISGGSVTKTGHTAPFMVIASVLAIISAGLLYTLDIGTSTGKWIGYQIIGGAGWGLAYQVPINAAQGAVEPSDIASVTAIIIFFQVVGGAILVSAAQGAFVNQLLKKLATTAPHIDAPLLLSTGASQLRDVFSPEDMPGILLAYMHGLKVVFAIALAAVAFSLVLTPFNSWKKINTGEDSSGDAPTTTAV